LTRTRAAKADAGPSQPEKITRQQRLEVLEQLADILLNIYGELTPEQQAIMSQSEQEAA
jgi:Spy/CpxP family protein refolding chaperone